MDELAGLIERAQGDMQAYQHRLRRDPALAQVSLGGVPHALVPTHVIARDLRKAIGDVAGAASTAPVMHRLGFLIGRAHAAAFFEDRAVAPSEFDYRVLTGPFHFAWAGYGDVDLLVWEPHRDDRFAVLWESRSSSSARAATSERERTRACHVEAGYSAGWCAEATGLPLAGCELACRAEGIAHCRFLIAHAERMRESVADPRFHKEARAYAVTPARIAAPSAGASAAS